MPAWIPILKVSLPYITQIVSTAIPAFTYRTASGKVDPIVAQQIEELQTAVTTNAESVHVLAEKLQLTIEGIDGAAQRLQKELVRMKWLLAGTTTVALAALVVAGISLMS